ncbi:GTP-binding protein HflX [Anaerobranca californiensis DSM 14826]|uniref:GTPase HflX n=1 Tax=Anaerobranca californiensis DSM 14826 TaxID=1120989 RepID=A0A1M6MJQ8_9FIRM|nr:GTPase HflX [Anaerobranca californiensis]SHJ83712.1 GTP-binding protein HflX [Anaerobranca californiensis DSM 14826]
MEKFITVFLELPKEPVDQYYIDETFSLINTAGGEVVQTFIQKREIPDVNFAIGKGKVDEILAYTENTEVDGIIFSFNLTPTQMKNWSKIFSGKIIDRTQLILDIFAQRATSNEGKIQVELAQMEYNLPRLVGMGTTLSRLGGGIGTRGPGETKLEMDRRHLREKINKLKKELAKIKKIRETGRKNRQKSDILKIALVGYTNSGKTSLLKRLTKSDIEGENKLFATLDPVTKKGYHQGISYTVTDTVGFVQNLPHQLVAAFRSTLEEVVYCDLILHVVDISSPDPLLQIRTVNKVLEELNVHQKPVIMVLNKIDLPHENWVLSNLHKDYQCVEISAKENLNIDKLKDYIKKFYDNK